MAWLKKDLLEPLASEFKEAVGLMTVEDPPDRPYDSKYEARNILSGIQQKVRKIETQKFLRSFSKPFPRSQFYFASVGHVLMQSAYPYPYSNVIHVYVPAHCANKLIVRDSQYSQKIKREEKL
jgi:hypothetical protein